MAKSKNRTRIVSKKVTLSKERLAEAERGLMEQMSHNSETYLSEKLAKYKDLAVVVD